MIRYFVLIAFLGALAAYTFKILLMMDPNKRVYNHRPGPCRRVEGIAHGSEDIALLEDEGLAFITSGIYYMSPRAKNVRGQIFLYDFKQKGTYKAEPLEIQGEYNKDDFNPHGLSHILTARAVIRLFVINHTKDFKHSVWILDWNTRTRQLDLVKIVENEKFIRPNNIMAISEESFMISNDGTAQTAMTNLLEIMSLRPSGSIAFFNGKESGWLLPSAVSPNGIILDRERKHLYVSHFNDRLITVYRVDEHTLTLFHVVDVPLGTAADNLYVAPDGSLWTGAHPVLKEAFAVFGDCDNLKKRSPSQVLRIEFSEDYESWEITEPFADDGRLITGSSVAIPYNKQLLIGSVCRELVHCDILTEETFQWKN
ncbi:unnamed protein product [Cylicocyclus nassatus]|uniref:Arylesterase n=1 Tax=Cylicocyclus nassatus TaxID=53992 RepID=A0AA36GL73_CYLNA|nr:unnamed protein product [Cylicocyclus nassatus]